MKAALNINAGRPLSMFKKKCHKITHIPTKLHQFMISSFSVIAWTLNRHTHGESPLKQYLLCQHGQCAGDKQNLFI